MATGVLSGAFGIGGAVLSTPGIRLLGASAFTAVGTTLPSILPAAVSGTVRYAREGLVDWPAVAWTAPAGVAGAVGGSVASHAVPGHGHWLMVLTAAIILGTAVRMSRPGKRSAAGQGRRRLPGGERPTQAGLGALAGLLSGLLGVGGGTIMLPGFTEVLGMPIQAAVATSLVCVGILAVPSTVAHSVLGDIDWRFAVLLAVGVVPGARLGAAAAIRAGSRRLRLAVAFLLGAIALGYGGTELFSALR